MKRYFALLAGLLLSWAGQRVSGQEPKVLQVLPPSTPAKAAQASPAQVAQAKTDDGPVAAVPVITLYERHGHVTPRRAGFQHTGAGVIDVAQPTPDVLIITMQGVAVAGPHPCKDSVASMDFDLVQCFDISLNGLKAKAAKLTMECRVIGALRSVRHGTADESGHAAVSAGPAEVVAVTAPAHSVSCGENLAINDHDGPAAVVVTPGKYTLHQVFHVGVSCPRSILCCKASSAEFAPDPALDPLWISYWEPFHGANKKDFGFQVVIRLVPE
jgi:hypothetical protein